MTQESRWTTSDVLRGEAYDRRFAELEATGVDVDGEAAFVMSLGPASVLDAGCGTGRVAIELARRGVDVVGVDLDLAMLDAARRKAPELTWVEADLATLELGRTFDVVLAAGNVMLFVAPGTEQAVVERLGAHLVDGGQLVAGFSLDERLALAHYDDMAARAGLLLEARYATWEGAPYVTGGGYAVSVHRKARAEDREVTPPPA